MSIDTAALARSITKSSSKQSYYTALLLVDRDLVEDCHRAYAYFRWVDDIVDISSRSREERVSFIRQQKDLINRLYRHERPEGLTPEEEIIADLIDNDRGENSGLQSFIRNFLAVLEFDAHRKGCLISENELQWYSSRLGKSITDAIQYFIRNGYPYPDADNRYLAATAAHITHMLRDMVEDTAEGYINIPREYLEAHVIDLENLDSPPFKAWVRERVDLARQYFRTGKRYLDELDVLRCKIAGYWYCVRFEVVLETIERDGYILRPEYNERRKLITWLKMAGRGVSLTFWHLVYRVRRGALHLVSNLGWKTSITKGQEGTGRGS